MAFSDPISVNDNSAVAQSFTRTTQDPNGSLWIEDDATTSVQRRLAIRHSNAGKSVASGAGPVRRHLIQWTIDKYNSLIAKTEKFTINVTITADPGVSLTSTDYGHIRAFAVNFLTDPNMAKILRDES